MAQQGKAPFISAWGFKYAQTSSRLELLRREVGAPPRIHTAWTSWWMADVTIVNQTVTLSDSIGGGGGGGTSDSGARNIFIGGGLS